LQFLFAFAMALHGAGIFKACILLVREVWLAFLMKLQNHLTDEKTQASLLIRCISLSLDNNDLVRAQGGQKQPGMSKF
jgi:hypothetical protein